MEEQFEYSQYFKNSRMIKHLEEQCLMKDDTPVIPDKVEFYISTDKSEDENLDKDKDQLFATEKLDEIREVMSSKVSSSRSSTKSSKDNDTSVIDGSVSQINQTQTVGAGASFIDQGDQTADADISIIDQSAEVGASFN